MMGSKPVEPKLYLSFSLDAAVPANHIVRRLAAAIDFDFVQGLVRKYYSHTGRPSVDPVVLFKLWLLGYLFNIRSERRLCEEAGLNLAWRWFLGYELDEQIPDHSVLTKARRRFGTRVYELFFRHIVQLCEAKGLIQGDVLYIDSTLSDANAARDTLRSRALAEPRLPEPARFVTELFAVNDPIPEPEAPRPKGGTGPKPSGKEREKPALRRSLISTTDPDAEVQTRHNGRSRLVYKTQVVVDGGNPGIITAIQVGPAGDSDASSVGPMLDKHSLTVRRAPRELVGDSGYGSEAAIREIVARGVLPTLNYKRPGNMTGGYSREDFIYDADRDLYICPAGLEMRRVAENFSTRKSRYGPKFGSCAKCPLKPQCCATSLRDRKIDRSWGASVVDEARGRVLTRIGKSRLRYRQVICERVMADLKSKHGLERAQFRRRPSFQIQALLTAAVFNIKQLLKRPLEVQGGVVTQPRASTRLLTGLATLPTGLCKALVAHHLIPAPICLA